MPVIRHRIIRVSDVNVLVRETGDPALPALVLLHGFPSSSRHYVRLMDRLAGHLLDTGHFALEVEADTIATAVDAFLAKHLD